MQKNIITFCVIWGLFIFVLWAIDPQGLVRVNWYLFSLKLSLVGFFAVVSLGAAISCFLTFCFHKVISKQIAEVNGLKLGKKGTAVGEERIILNRKDVDNAMMLLLKSMTSITEGDMKQARQNLAQLRKIIGHDMIIDVLMLKIYKGEKNFDKMEELSAQLMANPNLELVSMKASLEAQMQKKEFEQALATANKAFEVRQDLYWVTESAFNLRAKAEDWEGALQVLNAGYKKGLIHKEKYVELKAITLYQLAKEAQEKGDMLNFFKFCTQALDCSKTLVPAALAMARYYMDNDNQKTKAAHVLKKMWRYNPTAELAEAYLKLWPDDTPTERVQRMETLAFCNSLRPSLNNLLLAELNGKAGLWGKAKSEFGIFLINNPMTKRLAKTVVEYHKKAKKNNEFADIYREKNDSFADDGKWVCECCGRVSNKWHPTCKKCGKVGSFNWNLYVRKDDKTE